MSEVRERNWNSLSKKELEEEAAKRGALYAYCGYRGGFRLAECRSTER